MALLASMSCTLPSIIKLSENDENLTFIYTRVLACDALTHSFCMLNSICFEKCLFWIADIVSVTLLSNIDIDIDI